MTSKPDWVWAIAENLNTHIYTNDWYTEERKALEAVVSDWGEAMYVEDMHYVGWEFHQGERCDGCFYLDEGTTHNCRQRDRHDCDDFGGNCPDIVEMCQCTTCEEEL